MVGPEVGSEDPQEGTGALQPATGGVDPRLAGPPDIRQTRPGIGQVGRQQALELAAHIVRFDQSARHEAPFNPPGHASADYDAGASRPSPLGQLTPVPPRPQ